MALCSGFEPSPSGLPSATGGGLRVTSIDVRFLTSGSLVRGQSGTKKKTTQRVVSFWWCLLDSNQ